LGLQPGATYEYRFRFSSEKPFFLRRTKWHELSVRSPLVTPSESSQGRTPSSVKRCRRWSWHAPVAFGATLDKTHPAFRRLFNAEVPELEAAAYAKNPETGTTEERARLLLEPTQAGDTVQYAKSVELPCGSYAIAYAARGKDGQGRERVLRVTPSQLVVVDHCPFLWGAAALLLLALVCWAYRRRKRRIRGTIRIEVYPADRPSAPPAFEAEVELSSRSGRVRVPEDTPVLVEAPNGWGFELRKVVRFPCFRGAVCTITPKAPLTELSHGALELDVGGAYVVPCASRLEFERAGLRFEIEYVIT
jgi:hypothetical protein